MGYDAATARRRLMAHFTLQVTPPGFALTADPIIVSVLGDIPPWAYTAQYRVYQQSANGSWTDPNPFASSGSLGGDIPWTWRGKKSGTFRIEAEIAPTGTSLPPWLEFNHPVTRRLDGYKVRHRDVHIGLTTTTAVDPNGGTRITIAATMAPAPSGMVNQFQFVRDGAQRETSGTYAEASTWTSSPLALGTYPLSVNGRVYRPADDTVFAQGTASIPLFAIDGYADGSTIGFGIIPIVNVGDVTDESAVLTMRLDEVGTPPPIRGCLLSVFPEVGTTAIEQRGTPGVYNCNALGPITLPAGTYRLRWVFAWKMSEVPDGSPLSRQFLHEIPSYVVGAAPRFSVTGIRIDPARPSVRAPSTMVTVTIRNTSAGTLVQVPWQILVNHNLVGRGVLENVAAHTSLEVARTVTLSPGPNRIEGQVDYADDLNEDPAWRSDNEGTLIVEIPRLVTEDLDPARAAAAEATSRASFPANVIDAPPGGCPKLGVGSWRDSNWAPEAWTNRKTGVVFKAECAAVSAKANPEAYKGFLLQNGWLVKELDDPIANPSNEWKIGAAPPDPAHLTAGWRWITRPAIGTNNPYMQVSIWTEGGGAYVRVGVRVVIEGPEGSNPYTAAP
jgi:hypothetical protein